MRKFIEAESGIKDWGKKNGVHASVLEVIKHVPGMRDTQEMINVAADEFFINISRVLPSKVYIPVSKEQKLVEWLKLTHELFFAGL